MSYILVFLFTIIPIFLTIHYLNVLYEYYRKVKIVILRNTSNIEKSSVNQQILNTEKQIFNQAPGPFPWPILGDLAILSQYDFPFQGFTELSKIYGDVYKLTLGTTKCLVVNNLDLIREVLNQNGKFFGGRPDFIRFNTIFGGDRNNSLALCDWSQLQIKRRNLARKHCSPRNTSSYYTKMSEVGCMEMQVLMDELKIVITDGKDYHIKPLVMQTCANMFSQYMCSVRFEYDDVDFQKLVYKYDEIFWEINQGHALDFLPWLQPFYKNHLSKLGSWTSYIRKFILNRIVNDREHNFNNAENEKDFTDALLKSLAEDPTVTRDTIIYMLEDFIGGHSAIGNLVMLTLGYIAKHPEVGHEIQNEVDRISENGKKQITLGDREKLPYTVATIFEVLRYASSPIVPHVATENTCIAGYGVTKDTIIFINNYELNTSSKYWKNPERFDPKRFLEEVAVTTELQANVSLDRKISESSDSGIENEFGNNKTNIAKPLMKMFKFKKNIPHFLPFSIGKRTCIGQNLARSFSFIMVVNLLLEYNVSSNDLSKIKTNPACVALPPDTYPIALSRRNK